MLAIVSTTLPIFLIIAAGYGAVRRAILPAEAPRILGAFVLNIAMPALIFRAVALRPLTDVLNPTYYLAAAGGAFATAAVTYAVARRLLGRDALSSIVSAMGGCFGNSAYVGYPIAILAVGPAAALALSLAMVIENALILPLMLALADMAAAKGKSAVETLRATFANMLRNPLLIAIVIGMGASLAGVTPPAPVMRAIDMLANAATAAALVAVGGTLAGLSFTGLKADIGVMVAAKLLLHPALTLAVLMLLPPLDPDLRKALLITTASPMMSIYPLLAARYGQAALGAAGLLVATVLSFFTITALLALL